VVAAFLVALATTATAAELRVMTSGAFTAAYLALIPSCAESRGDSVVTVTTTMGSGDQSIPSRLQRREAADVVIVDRTALEQLIAHGSVRSGSRVDLARSAIGMAVRTGTAKPTIATTGELRRTLLAAGSIAYSASVSGDYLSGELFDRLGVASEVRSKSRRIVGERVGAVVARGEAEIGFQQISELLPIPGIDYVGSLPPELQKVTVFSAGLAAGAVQPQRAAAFIDCLASPAAAAIIARSGLEPRHVVPELRPEFRRLSRLGPFLEK
jgi:molybdate transport system substrate-binding protein